MMAPPSAQASAAAAPAWTRLRFRCPACGGDCTNQPAAVVCAVCATRYDVVHGIAAMAAGVAGQKVEIQEFWSRGARHRLETGDPGYGWKTQAELLANLARVEHRYATSGLFRNELPLASIGGRRVLEIGCGSGGASVVMCGHGADVVAGDLSIDRCANALRMHAASLWADRPFAAVQLDAERLPFPDGYFDAVFSNGVLHHTSDTAGAIREVHRVLKPGGVAAIMLYSRQSLMYAGLWAYHGLLRGGVWRDPEWLSHVSEQDDSVGGMKNPVTRAYTRAQVRQLFRDFRSVTVRQDSVALFSANRFRALAAVLTPLAPWIGWSMFMRAER